MDEVGAGDTGHRPRRETGLSPGSLSVKKRAEGVVSDTYLHTFLR